MPLPDLTNPNVVGFMAKCYEKEKILQAKWINLHKDEIYKAATLSREPKEYTSYDIRKFLNIAGMSYTSKGHAVTARHRYTKPVEDYLMVKVGVAKPVESPMMHVEKEVQDVLKEDRNEYLKVRAQLPPAKKYYFFETEYWKYGWHQVKSRAPEYGRVFLVHRDSRNRSGLTRDPDHYVDTDAIRNATTGCLK